MRAVVLTADQRGSTGGPDRVPEALETLDGVTAERRFERTAGDEVQGVITSAEAVGAAVQALLRARGWSIGLGVGEVEEPLPDSTRAGRGPAFLHAREAVTSAKSAPWALRVVGDDPGVRALETVLWLWAAVLGRRTKGGWEVAALALDGDGGAVSASEAEARRQALVPLERAARSALTAACSPEVWPPA